MNTTMFRGRAASPTGPAVAMRPVTPDDDADLPGGPARSLYVGVAGDVAIVDATGAQVVIPSSDTQYHPVWVHRVLATGTTAEGLFAIY